jgi:hypothetical protein
MFATRLSGSVAALVAVCVVSVQTQNAAPAPKSGIYLEQASGEPQKLPMETTMDVQTKGIMKAVLTQGFSKPKQVVTHASAASEFVVTDPQPSFLFVFDDPRAPIDPMQYMAMMGGGGGGGLPMGSKHPKEFALILMAVEGDTRVFDSGKVMKAKVDVQNIKTREFRVRPHEPLIAGEHAFMIGDPGKGGTPTMIWSFSYRPAVR